MIFFPFPQAFFKNLNLQFWYPGCENQLRTSTAIVFGRIIAAGNRFVWKKFLIPESVLLNPFLLNNNTNWNGSHIALTITGISNSQNKRSGNRPTLVLSCWLLVLKVSEISETNCSLILKTLQRTRTPDSLILEYSENHTTLEKTCIGLVHPF